MIVTILRIILWIIVIFANLFILASCAMINEMLKKNLDYGDFNVWEVLQFVKKNISLFWRKKK